MNPLGGQGFALSPARTTNIILFAGISSIDAAHRARKACLRRRREASLCVAVPRMCPFCVRAFYEQTTTKYVNCRHFRQAL
jgi:hypothetical protein